MSRLYSSDACNSNNHITCSGSVRVFDTPDGPNSYLCDCLCHKPLRKVTCKTCRGSGKVSTTEWTNDSSRLNKANL